MKAKEKAVRDAAAALATAIADAKEAGFTIAWPRRAEDLAFIQISETAVSHPTVTVTGAEPAVATKAAAAAQKVVDKANEG